MDKMSNSDIPSERTCGDGRDNVLDQIPEVFSRKINISSQRAKTILQSSKPVEPKLPIKILIPKYVPKSRKQKYFMYKQKEPRFIPYEPYKCAVQPIVPHKNILKKEVVYPKVSKNNVDINNLVEQMSEIRATELNESKLNIQSEGPLITKKQWEEEKLSLETDIKNLRETNSHLENQLKFQAQVNTELKTLLVAAVGEDLETRVQHLTEDKLQLARALLNSANHLTSHQEQTEWLSGQCEVWRSKFLASSLMVEELARWKSALTKRMSELQQNIKCLLEESDIVYEFTVKTNRCLTDIHENLQKVEKKNICFGNIIDTAKNNLSLVKEIKQNLDIAKISDSEELPSKKHTATEKMAYKLLSNPVSLPNKPDAICNAVMGAAMSLSSGQLYLQHPALHATCCSHCRGEVQEV